VETLPFGYPAIFDFLPDFDSYYKDWLQKPLSTQKEFKDLANELTGEWGRETKLKI
jgi:hypothetical protein